MTAYYCKDCCKVIPGEGNHSCRPVGDALKREAVASVKLTNAADAEGWGSKREATKAQDGPTDRYGWELLLKINGKEMVSREEAESNFNAFLEGQDERCAELEAQLQTANKALDESGGAVAQGMKTLQICIDGCGNDWNTKQMQDAQKSFGEAFKIALAALGRE